MTTGLRIRLAGPSGEPVDLIRTINSHGFSELPPMRLNGMSGGSLEVTIRVPSARPRRVRVWPGGRLAANVEIMGPRPGARVEKEVLEGVRRVLRLDQDLSGFYAMAAADPDLAWAASGAGRMLRSPTVFEDVVKTVCTTNCTWSATTRMVTALVEHLGEQPVGVADPLARAFPTPDRMAATPESFYRDVARAGYRGAYLISLARAQAAGDIDLETIAGDDIDDDELESRLRELPGVGPYAAAHIMMTLGRNSRLILDSWSRPTYARLVGRKTVSDSAITRRFSKYGAEAGLAFWLFITRDWVD